MAARNRIARLKSASKGPPPSPPKSKPTPTPTPPPPPAPLGEDGKPLTALSFVTALVATKGKIKSRTQSQTWGFVEDLGDGIKLEMVRIPAGNFTMGAPASEKLSWEVERPQHQVNIASFYIGRFEVTRAAKTQ